MKISAYILCKNNIHSLPRTIENTLQLCDQLIIVDTGSTDGTYGYIRDLQLHNSKMHVHKLEIEEKKYDASIVRNFALSKCSCEWILQIDSDEYLHSEQLVHSSIIRSTLYKFLIENSNADAIIFQVFNFLKSPFWVHRPPILNGEAIRLFKNRNDIKYKHIIHPELTGIKKIAVIPNIQLYHFQYYENSNIKEKTEFRKRQMIRRIKQEGWTAKNCNYYADIFRRKYIYSGEVKDLDIALKYFNKSLKKEYNKRVEKTINELRMTKNAIIKNKKEKQFAKNIRSFKRVG